MVLYDNRPLADNLTATDTWSVNRQIKEMLFLLGWILMNSGYCMISGICSKHNSYSSSETKSFFCRSVCLIRFFQNRISVSAESREENSGNFSIMESIISCLICPIDTYLISSWNKSVFSLETFFIPVHLLLFVIYMMYTLSVQGAKRSERLNLQFCYVTFNRRTSSTPLSSALKMGKIPMAGVGESEGAEFTVLQGTWMRRTGRTPIESNVAEL